MKKTGLFSDTLSAVLLSAAIVAMSGWNTALAEQAEGGEAAAATDEPATADAVTSPRGWSRRYDRDRNRSIARSKALAKQRREQLERWRSWRRWMNNPATEDRRQWNKARSQYHRDLAQRRSELAEERRGYYRNWYREKDGVRYGYEEWAVDRPDYRYGPWH